MSKEKAIGIYRVRIFWQPKAELPEQSVNSQHCRGKEKGNESNEKAPQKVAKQLLSLKARVLEQPKAE